MSTSSVLFYSTANGLTPKHKASAQCTTPAPALHTHRHAAETKHHQ